MPRSCFNCAAKIGLHKAPSSEEFRDLWLNIIPNIKTTDFNSSFKLCSLHFDKKYMNASGRLARNAVPSKFLLENGMWCSFLQNTYERNRHVNNREVLLENLKEFSTSSPPSIPDEPGVNFEYIEVKQEPTFDQEAPRPLQLPPPISTGSFEAPFLIKIEPVDEPLPTRHVNNREVLLENPKELSSSSPPSVPNESLINFEYVEIKQEPIFDQEAPRPLQVSPPPSPFVIKIEPADEPLPPSPATLGPPLRGLKRNWHERTKTIVPAKNYKETENKPIMVDTACQTEDLKLLDRNKDELIAKLKYQNKQLRLHLAAKQMDRQFGGIPIDSLKEQNKNVQYLTGFPNFVTMEIFYKDVEMYIQRVAGCKITQFDIFFMTWVKLKLNLSLNFLSILMNISNKLISQLFYETFIVLYGQLSQYIVWPNATEHPDTPSAYKQIFGDRRFIIVDCFEIFSERNNYMKSFASGSDSVQEQTIRTDKLKSQHRPAKYLICYSMAGTIIYISKPFDMRLSKRCIAEQSGFLDKVETNDIILADREFLSESFESPKRKSKDIVPMEKNVKCELVEVTFEISDEFNKIREDIVKRIRFMKQEILVHTDRPPIFAIIQKYGEMYEDFIIKMACAIVNLTSPQPVDLDETMISV